mmetsp:Transcript_99044/g.279846  ORF Transcript_99044/g.279846 Transcript_99044/m.279846 type:complete len:287 (-) Transcript_99044:2-862(-)
MPVSESMPRAMPFSIGKYAAPWAWPFSSSSHEGSESAQMALSHSSHPFSSRHKYFRRSEGMKESPTVVSSPSMGPPALSLILKGWIFWLQPYRSPPFKFAACILFATLFHSPGARQDAVGSVREGFPAKPADAKCEFRLVVLSSAPCSNERIELESKRSSLMALLAAPRSNEWSCARSFKRRIASEGTPRLEAGLCACFCCEVISWLPMSMCLNSFPHSVESIRICGRCGRGVEEARDSEAGTRIPSKQNSRSQFSFRPCSHPPNTACSSDSPKTLPGGAGDGRAP